MKYIPLTQNRVSVVDDEIFGIISEYKWYYHNNYATRHERLPNGKQVTILMHRFIVELSGVIIPHGIQIDHISRDTLDNRKNNLRLATHSQNQHNRIVCHNNISGYKGVYWFKRDKKWKVHIMIGSVNKYLGVFSDIIEAAQAYDQAAKKYHGEFAVLNFPER